MADTAVPDLVFPVACRHCAKPLHGEVRFCPYCGGEEAACREDAGAVTAAFEPKRWAPGRAEPKPQLAVDSAFVPRREVQPRVGFPAVLGAAQAPADGEDTEALLLGPAAFEWPEGLPAVITVEPRPPKPRLAARLAKPVAIGTTLVLSVLALTLGPRFFGQRSEPASLQAAMPKPAPAQGAPARGEFGAAPREPGALAAASPGPAGVQALHDELDQRERAQAARREQLLDAGQKAAQALGLSELSPPAPAAPRAADAPAAAPPAAAAPALAVQASAAACSQALAALSLCPQAEASPAPAR